MSSFLVHGVLSSPKADIRIETLYQLKKLNDISCNFYGLVVKVISSKRIIFFCYHLFREENILIDFLLKNLQNKNLLAKHDPSVHLIGLYTFGLT